MRKLYIPLIALLLTAILSVTAFADPADGLQNAIETAQSGDTVVLQENAGAVTVDKDLTLDLNGFDVAGITATGGVTVLVKDSKTDDYTVSDGDYGTVAATSGDVQPAEGYLAVPNGGVSYHKVIFKAASVVLRAENAGMYYTCEFAGDEVVREYIDGFGVALELNAAPTAETIAKDTAGKKRAEYNREAWTTGAVSQANGVLVKGILKKENGYTFNKRNATVPVYGAAYLRVGDTYYLGNVAGLTMQSAVEYADTKWTSLEDPQKNALLAMRETFDNVLKLWDIDNLNAAAQELYEKRTLKILCIGNSFSLDSMWILEHIAEAEGMKDLTLGILYHSGCSLAMHESYLLENKKEYNYYKNVGNGWTNTGGNATATMLTGIEDEDWDIVVLQQASSASGRAQTYNDDIQVIMDYVLDNDKNPDTVPQFAWNMTWAYPVEDDGVGEVTTNTTDAFKNYYGNDQMTMYNAIADAVKTKISPNTAFDYLMPVGTAIQNARSSYLGDPDLNRDYSHLSDLGRTVAAYTWYCILTGKTIDEISIDSVPASLRYFSADRNKGDLVLTDDLKQIMLESIQNALETPFKMSQSKYTTKS